MRDGDSADGFEEERAVNEGEEQFSARVVPSESDHDVDFVPDNLDTEDDEGLRMTLKEMQEAIDDKSHPHHEEALRESKKLAETMMPALESLRKQMSAQFDMSSVLKGIEFPTAKSLSLTGLNESIIKSIGSAIPKMDLMPEIDWPSKISQPVYTVPVIEPIHQPDFEELGDSLAEAAREREERAERQVEMAAAQLDTLQAMAANLQQLNQQMESVDRRLSQSNKSDGRSFGWTITVGALTLAATTIGIVVTVILNQS